MLKFTQSVKFLGTETRTGESNGKRWEMMEATVFVPDLGRVKIPVNGTPRLPANGQSGLLELDLEQGKFQAMRAVWNENASFKPAA